ncbi:hypothetical protein [Candidatus Phyllobacterium onerii]|uniref:hypothetical protein n=1 Tax=Candidatus Phyllobacterium onerii TaxID=3020828 RepID=UPI00232F0269|nr:hypothetical protein [Phyllobacterium sp. IY22]
MLKSYMCHRHEKPPVEGGLDQSAVLPWAVDPTDAEKLWDLSERLTGTKELWFGLMTDNAMPAHGSTCHIVGFVHLLHDHTLSKAADHSVSN